MTQRPKNRLQIRFDWKIALSVALACSLLMKLGFWQLNRADEKRQMQSVINARQEAVPRPIENLSLETKNALKYLRVSLDGSYINDKSIFIVGKLFQGRLGYEVITPFQLKSTGHIVFVSRGWMPGAYNRSQLPEITPITGQQQLVAEIYVPPGKSFFLTEKVKGKTWPIRLHYFNMGGFEKLFETALFPYVVRLTQGNHGVLERYWPTLTLKPEMSTSYAFQWFAMALVVLVVALIKGTNIVEITRNR